MSSTARCVPRRGLPVFRHPGWMRTLLLVGITACHEAPPPPPPPARPPPPLGPVQVRAAFPDEVSDPAGWAKDLLAAFADTGLVPDATRVCGVVAVLQQESGFQADPPVANLGALVRARLNEEAERYGPLGPAAMERLLQDRAPGDRRTFDARVRRLRTERELDLLFRDMLEAERREHPAMIATANLLDTLFRGRRLEDLNPVTTSGSMQVSVRWATEYARSRGWPDAEETVRDALYTRVGGLRFGVPRLWSYPLTDTDVLYRFADYNAGQYAARNAAVQRALAQLTGIKLAADGDLLAYGPDGQPTAEDSETLGAFRVFLERFVPAFPESRLRGDLQKGKEQGFEETPSYLALRRVYREQIGTPMATAVLPELELKSPKLRRGYTTAAYARNVLRHHRACLQRLRGE